MSDRKLLPLYQTLSMFILLSSCNVVTAATGGQVDVAIKPDSGSVVLHEPVSLYLTIQNKSPSIVKVDLGSDRKTNIILQVTEPDGTKQTGQVLQHEGLSRLGRIEIAPGNEYVQSLIVDDWVSFTKIGTYHVILRLKSPITLSTGTTLKLPPAAADVKVIEYNPDAIRAFCARALKQLLAARSYSDALTPAESLGRVYDTAAIPFLGQAFASSYPVHSLLIRALGAIGTDAAANTLLKAKSEYPNAAPEEMKAVLSKLKDRTSDLELRKAIALALNQ